MHLPDSWRTTRPREAVNSLALDGANPYALIDCRVGSLDTYLGKGVIGHDLGDKPEPVLSTRACPGPYRWLGGDPRDEPVRWVPGWWAT